MTFNSPMFGNCLSDKNQKLAAFSDRPADFSMRDTKIVNYP